MRFDESDDVGEILGLLALPAARFAPGLDLAGERVLERRHPQQDAMNIGRRRPAGKVPIKRFRRHLDRYRRATAEVDRPLEPLARETGLLEQAHDTIDVVEGDDEIDIARDHLLFGPVVDCDAPDATPRHIRSFEAIDESHHVIGSARGLPVEKLFFGHAAIESSRVHRVQMQ